MTAQKANEKELSPALGAENKRFKNCLKARKIVAAPPRQVTVYKKDPSLLARYPWFSAWQTDILDAGFLPAGHYSARGVGLSAYSNHDLSFDAILSERRDGPSYEVAAYHPDGTVTVVGNSPLHMDYDFNPQFLVRTDMNDASVEQMVEHLRQLVRGKELLPIDAASFAQRYTDLVNRVVVGIRERAQQILDTPTILVNGSPPRYERLRAYLDFAGAGWNDPGYSSENWVRDFKDDFAKADEDPPGSTEKAVDAAMYLVAMSHFQFASASDASEFLASACDVALAHFRALASTTTLCSEPWFQFRALLRGLLLCAVAGRWETFTEISNLVKPELAAANTAQEEDLDFAQVLLLLVSDYRDSALEKAASLERSVAKRVAKRPRLLLNIWRAVRAGRVSDFEGSSDESVGVFGPVAGRRLRFLRDGQAIEWGVKVWKK